MAPRPPVPNTVRIVLNWQGPNGTKAANIFHCLMGTGWTVTVPNLTTICNNVLTAYTTGTTYPMLNQTSTSWTLSTIQAFDNGGTTELESGISVATTGNNGGNCLPPQCSIGISWTIPAHYRGGHPRTYQPGIAESNLVAPGSNVLVSTGRGFWATAASSFLTHFNAALVGSITEALCALAFTRGGVPIAGGPVVYPITGGYVHGRLDTQRRRLGKESVYG